MYIKLIHVNMLVPAAMVTHSFTSLQKDGTHIWLQILAAPVSC